MPFQAGLCPLDLDESNKDLLKLSKKSSPSDYMKDEDVQASLFNKFNAQLPVIHEAHEANFSNQSVYSSSNQSRTVEENDLYKSEDDDETSKDQSKNKAKFDSMGKRNRHINIHKVEEDVAMLKRTLRPMNKSFSYHVDNPYIPPVVRRKSL